MRRIISALLIATFAAQAVLASISAAPAPEAPAPYNNLYVPLGDSRAGEDLPGAGQSGPGTYLQLFSGNRIRQDVTKNGYGIGGQTETQVFAWPRPTNPNIQAKAHIDNGTIGTAGAILTVTTLQNNAFALGQLVLIGSTYAGKIIGSAINSATCGGSACTGSTGLGTYLLDTATATYPANTSFTTSWVDSQTVAEVAAGQAATVYIIAGTNSGGADPASVIAGLKGLTIPGFKYPNYRPNGETTDQPLPLYPCTAANTATCRGKPKVVLLFGEFRKGKDWQGGLQNNSTDLSGLRAYKNKLARYAFDSLQPESLPNVVFADTFDGMGGYIDTSSGAPLLPLGGYHPDGLHITPTTAFPAGKLMMDKALPGLMSLRPLDRLFDTTTWSSSNTDHFSPNPFMTGTGGSSSGSATVTGTIPSSWQEACSFCTGFTVTNTTTAIGGTGSKLGSEFCVAVTGTPSASGSMTLKQIIASNRYSTLLSTDTLRWSWRERYTIISGYIYDIKSKLLYNGSTTGMSSPGDGGTYSAGNFMLYKAPAANSNVTPAADTSHDYMTIMANADMTGVAAPSAMVVQHVINWYTGQDVNITYCVAQDSLIRSATGF